MRKQLNHAEELIAECSWGSTTLQKEGCIVSVLVFTKGQATSGSGVSR
jgi:hypothetical protein